MLTLLFIEWKVKVPCMLKIAVTGAYLEYLILGMSCYTHLYYRMEKVHGEIDVNLALYDILLFFHFIFLVDYGVLPG